MAEQQDPRNSLVGRVTSLQSRAMDLVFSISSGALILSVTFQSSIVPGDLANKTDLKLAWVCFAASIMARVFGLVAESAVWLKVFDTEVNELPKWRQFLVNVFTAILYFGFVGGVGLFASFAIANV